MVLQLNLDMCLSSTALHEALALFKKNDLITTGFRLILSHDYLHSDILEIIFRCRGSLDIPFEMSYALPLGAWIVANDNGDIFYSKGD